MEINNRFITVHGIRTHYFEAGEKERPVVVLLHGGGLDCAELSWGGVIPALAEHFRVIAPDLPGYGETEKPSLRYGTAFYEGFVTEFLDQLGIQRTSLVGLSMGGGIALAFALRSPQCVEKLVLVDSYGLQRKAPWQRLSYLFLKIPGINEASWAMMRSRAMVQYGLKALLQRPGSLTVELVDMAYREVKRPGIGLAWRAFQNDEITWNGTRTCFIDRLGEIHVPTLILHGSKDTLVPAACAREAHERIVGSALYWMEGCGHWPQRDNPEEFKRVLVEFLTAR